MTARKHNDALPEAGAKGDTKLTRYRKPCYMRPLGIISTSPAGISPDNEV